MIGHSAGVLTAAAVPLHAQSTPVSREQAASEADLTGRVARYMAAARQQSLSADVVREAKHRILDTIAAMISGARLKPGEMAIRFARAEGGTIKTSARKALHKASGIYVSTISDDSAKS